jgi:hypothetical protein
LILGQSILYISIGGSLVSLSKFVGLDGFL